MTLFGDDPDADPLEPAPADAPLADRMRPRTLEEFVGQAHLVEPGKILAPVLAGEQTQSLILWGPPGVGKTTLARLIAAGGELRFVPYSAVLSGIKEIKAVMADAQAQRRSAGHSSQGFLCFSFGCSCFAFLDGSDLHTAFDSKAHGLCT